MAATTRECAADADQIFGEAKDCTVSLVPVDGQLMLDGFCFPLRNHLKELGFTYTLDFVPGADRWTIDSDKIDVDEVANLFEEHGWDVVKCTHTITED